jgi:Domain of unknown function (DUF1707)
MSAGYQDWTGSGMRVSDADREATAAELREHYASGRLTLDELNERINNAFAAKTRGDLTAVMHDLPSLRPGTTPPTAGQPSSGAGWGGPGSGAPGWGGQGGHHGPQGPRQAIGSLITSLVAVCVLAWFGIMAVAGFGAGGGRPLGIGLIIAAIALLRRLFFGRRRARRVRTRRPHPRRRF